MYFLSNNLDNFYVRYGFVLSPKISIRRVEQKLISPFHLILMGHLMAHLKMETVFLQIHLISDFCTET